MGKLYHIEPIEEYVKRTEQPTVNLGELFDGAPAYCFGFALILLIGILAFDKCSSNETKVTTTTTRQ